MRRGDRDETLTFHGRSLTYRQPGWHCEACGDGVLEDADNEVHDAALHELMALARNTPISPLVVRAAREAVGLSQRQAGKVFGGGPTAFHKYETAKAVPSLGMATLLRLALARPELFKAPGRGAAAIPGSGDIEQLRGAVPQGRLSRIVRHVYPG